jgi:hypothetical protein
VYIHPETNNKGDVVFPQITRERLSISISKPRDPDWASPLTPTIPSPGPQPTVCALPPTTPPRRDGERRPGAEAGVRGLRLAIGPLRHRVQAHHALQHLRQENGAFPRSMPRLLRSNHQPNPGMDPSVSACL